MDPNPSSTPKVPRPPGNPHPLWTLPKLDAAPSCDDHIRRSSRTDSPVVDYCSPGRVKPFGKEKWRDNPAQYIQRNPAYGKIWAGMHIAIAQDLMERYQLSLALQLVPLLTPGLKCASPDLEEGSNKKSKRTVRAKSGGKRTRATTGATGDVFAATIPNVKHGPIVVKLATTFSRLCRLRHEYSVYAYLKSANVKCIPRVYGFYQDAHRGPLGGRRAKLTADEKTRIRAAVSSIHAAGVLHRDLRTWNILVNDAGGISIIDFDRANTDAQDKDIQVEWERLEKLLKGKHVENGEIIGKDGMPANIGDLVNDNPDA
ncbi:hypothetical protein CPB85DRAFT_1449787 [Mucidula mucida]|nr:hypothetical protein CPB85DRAFT_1449787 [Mucidula mucida]